MADVVSAEPSPVQLVVDKLDVTDPGLQTTDDFFVRLFPDLVPWIGGEMSAPIVMSVSENDMPGYRRTLHKVARLVAAGDVELTR